MSTDRTLNDQRALWREALKRNPDSPRAVGSESMDHKHIRYERISRLFQGETSFSLHDVGAGLGHYYEYLQEHHGGLDIEYSASDITKEFCDMASEAHPAVAFIHRDIVTESADDLHDYVVLSGVFHQRGGSSHSDWLDYMKALVASAFQMARRGMAFNVMSQYADYYNSENFYPALAEVQDFVARRLSRFFVVDHAYPLYEATISVYTGAEVARRYPADGFKTYLRS